MENNKPFDPKDTLAARLAKSTFQIAVEAYIKVIQGYAPFLALPVIAQIFTFAVVQFSNGLFTFLADGASGIIIDLRVDKENSDYKKSVSKLEEAIKTQSPEEIKKQDEQFKETLRKLINL